MKKFIFFLALCAIQTSITASQAVNAIKMKLSAVLARDTKLAAVIYLSTESLTVAEKKEKSASDSAFRTVTPEPIRTFSTLVRELEEVYASYTEEERELRVVADIRETVEAVIASLPVFEDQLVTDPR